MALDFWKKATMIPMKFTSIPVLQMKSALPRSTLNDAKVEQQVLTIDEQTHPERRTDGEQGLLS